MASEGPDRAVEAVDGPSLDDLFRVMRDPHRRIALYFLVEHGRISITELEDVVTGWSHASDGTVATPEHRDRISLALHSVHLATMESANVLTVDHEDEEVVLADLSAPYRSFVRWSASVDNPVTPT